MLQHHQGPAGPAGAAFRMAAAGIFNEELVRLHGENWWVRGYRSTNDDVMLNLRVMEMTPGTSPWPGSHGAWGETEPVLALAPEAVDMSLLVRGDFPFNWDPGNEADRSSAENGMAAITRIVQEWVSFFHATWPQTRKG